MALVTNIDRASKSAKKHEPVQCTYDIVIVNGEPLLQLDTYGRKSRKFPGKVSQSLQLSRNAAVALRQIIDDAFGV